METFSSLKTKRSRRGHFKLMVNGQQCGYSHINIGFGAMTALYAWNFYYALKLIQWGDSWQCCSVECMIRMMNDAFHQFLHLILCIYSFYACFMVSKPNQNHGIEQHRARMHCLSTLLLCIPHALPSRHYLLFSCCHVTHQNNK